MALVFILLMINWYARATVFASRDLANNGRFLCSEVSDPNQRKTTNEHQWTRMSRRVLSWRQGDGGFPLAGILVVFQGEAGFPEKMLHGMVLGKHVAHESAQLFVLADFQE